ncbi:MFS transporter [Streptomyces gardneri]|uniref:MFS transporter n=1 Tax=Streptomyces gardneri TaxID=66892 RepID=UPI0035E0FBC5
MPRYLVTAFFARLADEGTAVAVVMLAVARTGSAAHGAFVLTAWMAPHVLAAPLAGALAERARRPRLFHCGALGGFALAISAVAFSVGRLPLPLVLVVAAAGGCCGPIVSGGLSSLISRLLPAGAERDRAYSWDAVVYNAAAVGGPGAAGLLASAVSPAAAMLALSAAAACACALTALLPLRADIAAEAPAGTEAPALAEGATEAPTGAEAPTGTEAFTGAEASPMAPTRLRRDLADGLRTVWRERELRAITAATCLAFTGIGALTTTGVLLATHLGSAGAGGLLMTAFAVGALAGTLGLTRVRPTVSPQRLAVIGLAGTALGLAAAASAPSVPVAAACFAVAGAFDGLVLTVTLRLRADHSPTRRRTQVFTIGAGLKMSAAAAGSALAGLATAGTAREYLAGIALVQAAAALLYVLTRRDARRGTRREVSGGRCGHGAGRSRPSVRPRS